MRAVSAVVPAAGLSSRFGGPNKLLKPHGDTTVVGAVVQTLLACDLEVVVVTGRDAEDVAEACKRASIAFNPNFASGLGSSIACGVRAASNDAVLIALADMPALRADVVRMLIDALTDDMSIVAPLYSDFPGRRGHPVLFGAHYRPMLASISGDQGANSIIEASAARLRLVGVDGRLEDIDTPSDL